LQTLTCVWGSIVYFFTNLNRCVGEVLFSKQRKKERDKEERKKERMNE
jgi:hypothetical protein